MKKLVIKPEGWPCTFGECRPGYFIITKVATYGELFLKTEYSSNEHPDNFDAYCATGEYFWGGTTTKEDRNNIIVQPVEVVWEECDGWLP
jgi:hypothetical protein